MNAVVAGLRREADQFIASMPGDVAATFSADQHSAIAGVLHQRAWRRSRINVRVSLPLLSRRVFLTLVAGIDKRSAARRADERSIHPLRTLGNLLFMGTLLAVPYGALAIGLLVQSSILEF
ncbi:MAG: hypothetical protein IID55_08740 [Proteobacteria bacterium]|nr:hypothetical protein [Pseudomonadota bacterium]